MIEVRIESGIDTAMISVLRQLPRNSRIISAVRQAGDHASRTTPSTAARTNSDWSASGSIFSSGGSAGQRCAAASRLTRSTMSSVEALPVFWIVSSTARWPSCAHDVGLRREAVAHVGDVADVDRAAADGLDRQVVQLRRRLRAAVQVDVVLERADLRGAGRQDQVLRVDRVDHVERRQPFGLQRGRVEVDHDLPLLAAVGKRHRRALHRGELRADEVDAEVEQLLLRQRLARERELQDRHGRRVVAQDQRRRRAGRAAGAAASARSRSPAPSPVSMLAPGWKNTLTTPMPSSDCDSMCSMSLTVVVSARSKCRHDAPFHLLGGEPGVAPDDAHDRDVDVREDVGRRAQDGERARGSGSAAPAR